jgi:hypothetical protein
MLYVSPMAIASTARKLVDQLGDDAPDLAIRKASQMERLGNKTGRTDWLCVMISAQRMLVDRHGW